MIEARITTSYHVLAQISRSLVLVMANSYAEMSQTNEMLINSYNQAVNYNDPYYLTSGDINSLQQLGFIDGSLSKPSENSPDLNKWIRNDYMVMSWLTSSMDQDVLKMMQQQQFFSPLSGTPQSSVNFAGPCE
ncbi:uncharacterized protein LOC141724040 [Apium graveolens]|uniref:uncharacterized protein LOC141724040 n=1 Tax=Apium graveolens TaxID=4045 RepID=UPI003D796A71